MFIQNIKASIETLPVTELELCDLSNEIGIVIANLAGFDKKIETEVTTGITHGFGLVRQLNKP